MDSNDDAKLNEFDKNEWWDVCRVMNPVITREEYEVLWAGFVALKAEHERAKALQ